MKINLNIIESEGFIARVALQTDEGLLLTTSPSILWAGKEDKEKIIRTFNSFVDFLVEHGIIIENLDEFKNKLAEYI